MAKRNAPKLFRVQIAGVIFDGDNRIHLNPDTTVYREDHPWVQHYPHLFTEVTVEGPARQVIEQATAAPGEVRQVGEQ